ncbi:MAG: ASCH domain-containing protein [Methanotrichaceae archaeon]|nr:ASCH domain-containing protein [Methanotrichaceae archaeon]
MNSITFRSDHIRMIMEGRKTQTRRNWKDQYAKRMRPGTLLAVKNSRFSKEIYCKIKLIDVHQERLGDISKEDASKEGCYSIDEYQNVWEEINGMGSWKLDTFVSVVTFEVDSDSKIFLF